MIKIFVSDKPDCYTPSRFHMYSSSFDLHGVGSSCSSSSGIISLHLAYDEDSKDLRGVKYKCCYVPHYEESLLESTPVSYYDKEDYEAINLKRYNLDCKQGMLGKVTGFNSRQGRGFNYECKTSRKPTTCARPRKADFQVGYEDEHLKWPNKASITCDKNYFISQLKLVDAPGAQGKYIFEYTCCKVHQ